MAYWLKMAFKCNQAKLVMCKKRLAFEANINLLESVKNSLICSLILN